MKTLQDKVNNERLCETLGSPLPPSLLGPLRTLSVSQFGRTFFKRPL